MAVTHVQCNADGCGCADRERADERCPAEGWVTRPAGAEAGRLCGSGGGLGSITHARLRSYGVWLAGSSASQGTSRLPRVFLLRRLTSTEHGARSSVFFCESEMHDRIKGILRYS